MKWIAWLLVGAVAAITVKSMPDLTRYMKMKKM